MLKNLHNNLFNPDATRADANPMINLSAKSNESDQDDVEVIDLDDVRGQIKPTTWHR